MAELTPIEAAVLQVLSWQSPGYLCSPVASAFVSQGLENPTQIEEALISLQDKGYTEFFTEEEATDVVKIERDAKGQAVADEKTGAIIPIRDKDGNLQIETLRKTVDAGWVITTAGKGKV